MKINISLVYAPNVTEQDYIEISVPSGSTIYQALNLAGWLEKYPEISQWCEQVITSETGLATKVSNRQWHVGIYSQKKPLNYQLHNNDRIELYRPLTVDPMKRRKRKATW